MRTPRPIYFRRVTTLVWKAVPRSFLSFSSRNSFEGPRNGKLTWTERKRWRETTRYPLTRGARRLRRVYGAGVDTRGCVVVGSDVTGRLDDVKAGKRYVTQAWRGSGWPDHPVAYFQPSSIPGTPSPCLVFFSLPLPRATLRQSVGSTESNHVGVLSNRI